MTPDDILHAEFPEQAMQYLHASFDGLPHGTHALWGLSYWLRDRGDQMGARMVADWAQEFAEHEANRANAAAARGGATRLPARRESPAASSRRRSLDLGDCSLEAFAAAVQDAANSAPRSQRWHDAVFISGVWDALNRQGDPGISLERFKRRLVQAYQDDLLDLSRADLVEAMPHDQVVASETSHGGARFHFVRLRGASGSAGDGLVVQAALELAPRGRRVLLRDLRPLLGGSRVSQDQALLQAQDDGAILLYREDSPGRHSLDESAVFVNGQPRHLLIVT